MFHIPFWLSIVFAFLFLSPAVAQEQSASKLSLFMQGAATLPDSSREIFVEMAGGKKAYLVVIPTACADADLPTEAELSETWGKFGIKNIAILHTRDPNIANDPEFVKPLETATAVWISGGDQRRLSDSYWQTAVEKKLRELANRGTVVGGVSAGAAIQSRVMVQEGREISPTGTGFNLLPNAIVDPQFLNRSPRNRLTSAVESFPTRTGIGIGEGASLVIEGDHAKVIGSGFVVSIRKVGDRFVRSSFPAGSTFELKLLNLQPQDTPLEVVELPGAARLFANKDQLDDFLIKSATEAEKLRHSFLRSDEFEPKAMSLAKLVQRFVVAHAGHVESHPNSKRLFPITIEEFVDGFGGSSEELDGVAIYAPFAGQWQGRWAQNTVHHHWSDLLQPNGGMGYRFFDSKDSNVRFSVSDYQYAWIGDGYGLNMVASETRGNRKRHYLLGYVEHLHEGDFSHVTARRPHVGIDAGNGRLVWVTEREVFFEEAIPRTTGAEEDAYSIIGFNYEILGETLVANGGFQTLYKRKSSGSTKLPDFEIFEFSSEQRRAVAVPAQH